jgi:hypothetical protein
MTATGWLSDSRRTARICGAWPIAYLRGVAYRLLG